MNTTLLRLIKGNSDRNAIISFHPLTFELRVPVISRHAPILHYKVQTLHLTLQVRQVRIISSRNDDENFLSELRIF